MEQLWLDSTWRRGSGSLKQFVKRHNQLLTVIAAGIVFATFVIKDAYQESLKELSDTISQAKSSFHIDEQFTNLETGIDNIHHQITDFRDEQKKGSDAGPASLAFGRAESLFIDEKSQMEGLIKLLNVSHLRDDAARNKLLDVGGKLENFKQRSTSFSGNTLSAVKDEDTRESLDLVDNVPKLNVARSLILTDVEAEQTNRERRVHECTIASYVLYPVGWMIALIGKLFGQDDEIDTD